MQDISSSIEILRKRLGQRLCIMGHHYECDAVIRHCDFTGDSLELARHIPDITAEYIVFCGVTFMGESAALLAHADQKVILPEPAADCQMALMSQAQQAKKVLVQLQESGKKFLPLAYVNTDVPLKAVVGKFGGAVCTSSNAKTMLQWAFRQSPHVLFLPDQHLGRNTARQLGLDESSWHVLQLGEDGIKPGEAPFLDRHLLLWPGYCPVHAAYTPAMVNAMRFAHPGCQIIVHPEASPEVVEHCDTAGSTSLLIQKAAEAARTGKPEVLVIGTELNLVRRLENKHMHKCTIIPLLEGAENTCPDMALVTEEKLLASLQAVEQGTASAVQLNAADREPAKLALTRMLETCR